MTNLETLDFYLEAKTPCLWIHTYEEARVIEDLREICYNKEYKAQIWSCTEGLTEMRVTNLESQKPTNDTLKNPDILLNHIKTQHEEGANDTLWILRDMDKAFAQYPFLYRHIRDIKEYNKGVKYHPILVISTTSHIPAELDKIFTFIDYETMTFEELEGITQKMAMAAKTKFPEEPEISSTTIRSIAQNLGGLTFIEATNILKRSVIAKHTLDLKFVMAEKIKLIQKTDVLEYKVPQTDFDAIGGNENFKNWVTTLEAAMDPEAIKFGCERPKGYVSLGIPGTGKSFMAEALAAKLGIPYIEFNIAKIMSSLVGSSERNMEEAVRLVKASAPCVFLIDEVEKLFGGIGSANQASDGNTSSRVMSSLLKLLATPNTGVITVMTSNDVSQLPPELTREGRTNGTWFFGLPTLDERKQIFEIHLNKTKKAYDTSLINEIAKATDSYTGAEIESIVHKSVWHAYARYKKDGVDEILLEDLLNAKKQVIPIAESSKDKINYLQNWAKGKAQFASATVDKAMKQKAEAYDKYESMLKL